MRRLPLARLHRLALLAAPLLIVACEDSTGPDSNGEEVTPVQSSSVAVGVTHTCGIAADDRAYCWGNNSYGLLGTGQIDLTPHPIPKPVVTGAEFKTLGSQGGFTCGLVASGQAYCWGVDRGGSLGTTSTQACDGEIGPRPCSSVPIPVATDLTFDEIAVMWSHACGIAADDRAFCWGNNDRGQAGSGFTPTVPNLVSGTLRFTTITGGNEHTCGIATDQRTYCWGDNREGQLGLGSSDATVRSRPTAVSTNVRFLTLSGHGQNGGHTCGIANDGDTYCWGSNDYGQLGVGSSTDIAVPTPVATSIDFAVVAAGYNWTCALTHQGKAYCWGASVAGSIPSTNQTCSGPVGDLPCAPTPVPIAPHLTFLAIRAGFGSACGVSPDGHAHCWGANDTGKLGNGTTADSATPTQVTGLQFPIRTTEE